MAFFENIGKALTDAGESVGKQARNFADVTKLNNAIADRERQINQLFFEIGKSYYQQHQDDANSEESERVSAINALYAEIEQQREVIRQIKGVENCKSCGAEMPVGVAFCAFCGAPNQNIAPRTSAKAESSASQTRVCPNCHMDMPADCMFCISCGAKME